MNHKFVFERKEQSKTFSTRELVAKNLIAILFGLALLPSGGCDQISSKSQDGQGVGESAIDSNTDQTKDRLGKRAESSVSQKEGRGNMPIPESPETSLSQSSFEQNQSNANGSKERANVPEKERSNSLIEKKGTDKKKPITSNSKGVEILPIIQDFEKNNEIIRDEMRALNSQTQGYTEKVNTILVVALILTSAVLLAGIMGIYFLTRRQEKGREVKGRSFSSQSRDGVNFKKIDHRVEMPSNQTERVLAVDNQEMEEGVSETVTGESNLPKSIKQEPREDPLPDAGLNTRDVDEHIAQIVDALKTFDEERLQPTLTAINKIDQETSQKIIEIFDTLNIFRTNLDAREAEIDRWKKGYDSAVFMKFVSRFARVDQAISEDLVAHESGKRSINAATLEGIQELLSDALDECGVERFSPSVGDDYKTAFGIDENFSPAPTKDSEKFYKIEKVIEPGYLIRGNDNGNDICIRKAKVSVFVKEN
ncbi:MAG: hypothetical protein KC643_27290 [Nitrospira sp.]|nr:hypothetical protein [Nitrospira sp.]